MNIEEINTNKQLVIVVQKSTSYVIPRSVCSIGSFCFRHYYHLSEVVFDTPHLVSIHSYAFEKTKIQILDLRNCTNLIDIHEYAFKSCQKLHTVYFPDSLKFIYNGTFYSCYSLESIHFSKESNITQIHPYSLSYTKIETIFIPKHLINFSSMALFATNTFKSFVVDEENEKFMIIDNCLVSRKAKALIKHPCNLPHIHKLHINSTIKRIECLAFYNVDIEYLYVPRSISTLCNSVFAYSRIVNIIFLPNKKLKTINHHSFAFNDKLILVNMTSCSVIEELKSCAFYLSHALEEFIVPDSLQRIYHYSFGRCYNLKRFIISKSSRLDRIDEYVFELTQINHFFISKYLTRIGRGTLHVDTLTNVTIDEENTYFSKVGPFIICNTPYAIFHYFFMLENETVTIPEKFTIIREMGFYGATHMKQIVLPSGALNIIMANAFSFSGLERIIIPKSVTIIGEECFSNCSNLVYVDVRAKIQKLVPGVFRGCSNLRVLNLPDSLHIIKENIFIGCKSITCVYANENIHSNLFRQLPRRVIQSSQCRIYNYKVFAI